jgi:hypothetical protein
MKALHRADATLRRDYTDEEIRSFVGDLESLQSGELTVSLLVGCGPRAIAPLREFLLHGKPRGIFQPRQRAVEALAELGARDVLLEFLSQERQIEDAVVRFGEEAVESSAARELGRWHTEEVFQFLMQLGERRRLIGVIEALGSFERPEAAGLLVGALEDDVCRPGAETALRRIAGRAKPTLFEAVQANVEEERPAALYRRRRVLRILADLKLSPEEWETLRPLLKDRDTEITVDAAQLAMEAAPHAEKREAAELLIRSLERAPWFQQIQIHECLDRHYALVRDLIAKEIEKLQQKPRREQGNDHVLRILLAVRLARETLGKAEAGRDVGSRR